MCEEVRCVECGGNLRDPKRRGDPDVNGGWVCSRLECRAMHKVEMECDIVVNRNG